MDLAGGSLFVVAEREPPFSFFAAVNRWATMDLQLHQMSKRIYPALLENSDNEKVSETPHAGGSGASVVRLKALESFFRNLVEAPGMAFVVIDPLSPGRESQIAKLLQQCTRMPVTQVVAPVQMKEGHIYVVPPGNNLALADGHTERSEGPHFPNAPINHIPAPSFADEHVTVEFREVRIPARRYEGNGFSVEASGTTNRADTPSEAGHSSLEKAEATIRQLEEERDRMKETLVTMMEEHGVAHEAMTASCEELRSVNEGLRSTAKELETSNKELQTVNEELLALNEELNNKIEEAGKGHDDLLNLMNATEIGTIFLDRNLCIKSYTPRVKDLFDISRADLGRRLEKLKHQFGSIDIAGDAVRVMHEPTPTEREVKHQSTKHWYLVRTRPYQGISGSTDGVVITFTDVTERKKYAEKLEALVGTLDKLLSARADQIKQLIAELVQSEHSERKRISHVLHDELQQLLVAFQMRAGPLSNGLPKAKATRLEQANSLVARALHVARTLTTELNPPVLHEDSITLTLEWLARRMAKMHDLKVQVVSPGPICLPAELRILVYQLVRELLFNVVKHSGVDQAGVEVDLLEGQLILTVEDHGVGFDSTVELERPPANQGGLGLQSVRERLRLLGGRLDVKSSPGEGTRATLLIPRCLEAAAEATTSPGFESVQAIRDL